jgi:DNA-binding MarR family transcriptional regulator
MNANELESALAAATALGLSSPSKIRALLHLFERPQTPMVSLAMLLRISSAGVTGIVDDLQKLGYLRREYGTQDRRQILIALTLSGHILCERILNPEGTPHFITPA